MNPLLFAALSLMFAGVGFMVSGNGGRLAVLILLGGIVRLFIGAALLLLTDRAQWTCQGERHANLDGAASLRMGAGSSVQEGITDCSRPRPLT